jgi:hypothetical protein
VDSSHAVYVVGTAYSSLDFPGAGLGRSTLNGPEDAFLTKIDPSGTQLLYSGYLGGSGADWGTGVALDQQGNPYVGLGTCSSDLPVSPGRQPYPGGCSAYLIALDSPGEYRFSTYLGGGDETGISIALDANSNVYVVGSTRSQHFPVTYDAYQFYKPSSRPERYSGFFMKLMPWLDRIYSTYFGGWDQDTGLSGVAVNAAGEIYLAGQTSAAIFPGPTSPVLPPIHPSGFVCKLALTGQPLRYTTFLGAGTGGVAVFQSWSGLGSGPVDVYAAGIRYALGPGDSSDVFVTKFSEIPSRTF